MKGLSRLDSVITIFGLEKVRKLEGEESLYVVDKDYRLSVSKILDVRKFEFENEREVYEIKTKGRRGDIAVSSGYSLVKWDREEEKDVECFVEDIKEGDKLLGFRNSIIIYEMGVKANNYYTVKSIKRKKVNELYRIDISGDYILNNNLIMGI